MHGTNKSNAARGGLGAVLATLTGILAGCGDGADNPLVGTWRLAAGSECTIDQITFTPGNVINRNAAGSHDPGRESTVPVTYQMDGPTRITATNRDQATSVTYVLSGGNRMSMGDESRCVFER